MAAWQDGLPDTSLGNPHRPGGRWANLIAWLDAHAVYVALAVALAGGLAIRLQHTLSAGFPLNDGGLFYTMTRDLQHHSYALPSVTSYNHGDIPFAYPPLPFYMAAAIDDLTPISLLQVVRWLPFLTNALSIGAAFLLFRTMLSSHKPLALAIVIFAFLPRSYTWLIMGGGLTRSTAFLLALLALFSLTLLYTRRDKRYLPGAVLFASLTVLSHPAVAWFLVFSCALFFAAYGRHRFGVLSSVAVTVGVLAATSPWWITLLVRHDLSVLVDGASTGGHSLNSWRAFDTWAFTDERFLNWPALLGLVGAAYAVAHRNILIPAWLLAILVLEPRSGATYASVPLAMLDALGALALFHAIGSWASAANGAVAKHHLAGLLPTFAGVTLAAYITSLAIRQAVLPVSLLDGLSGGDRAAMAWVAEHMEEDANAAVMTGFFRPNTDRVSEWFPALTHRGSVGTLQGYEWLGRDAYDRQSKRYLELQVCAYIDDDCLEKWAKDAPVSFAFVYVADNCCLAFERSLRASPRYRIVYDSDAASIFERRPDSAQKPRGLRPRS